ncbi:MAG TPA: nuclear transport factor 2 family protein [Mucilaginibacter sp.]|jgi:hypothetical protein
MKTLKSALTAIALLFICVAANATAKPINGKPTKNDIVNLYVDAIAHGKADVLDKIIDDGLQFDIVRGENINNLNKSQLIDDLKNNGTLSQPVSTNTTVVIDDDNSLVVKVEFKYNNFTRTDRLTIENLNGWAITKIISTFK